MRRRAFLALSVSVLAALGVRAQGQRVRVGYLSPASPPDANLESAPEKARPRRGPGRGCADHERGATRASEIHELKHSSVVASALVRSEPWALSFRFNGRLLESGCLGDQAERYVVIRLAAMVHHRA